MAGNSRTSRSEQVRAAAAPKKVARSSRVTQRQSPTTPNTHTDAIPSAQPETDVGAMIRRERKAKQMTLAQLAALADVSISYVSQVERGIANPTLANLKTLAHALGSTVGSLLDGSSEQAAPAATSLTEDTVHVLRAGHRRRVIYPGSHIANELLSPNLRVQMEVIQVEAPPGSGSGGHPHTHAGEECGVVISGQMRFWVDGEELLLEEHDSIYFPSHLPHYWESAGDVDLFAIWIITPPTF